MAPSNRPKKRTKTSSNAALADDHEANVKQLSKTLGISEEQVRAMLDAQGAGLPTATASSGRSSRRSRPAVEKPKAAKAANSSAWDDFIQNEMPLVNGNCSGDNGGKKGAASEETTVAESNGSGEVSSCTTEDTRTYILPIKALSATPGVLAQTGTLNSSIAGRDKLTNALLTKDNEHIHLGSPTILFPNSVFDNVPISHIATSCSSCHSLVVDVNGALYGWGRNEMNQLGNFDEKDIMIPRKLEGPWSEPIVAAATGKSHSVVVDASGSMYSVGLNKNGQCGVGQNAEKIKDWKKCGTVSDFSRKKGDSADKRGTIFVQVSCGENFTVALDDEGKLWTTGSAEFGCTGSGSTGEHFITANKIAFADSNRFELRDTFVTKNEKDNSVSLPDTSRIRLGRISCGKYHTLAVEALSENGKQPRVFSWGSGNFGCLGHRVQQDEYYPRMIESFNTALFTSNSPIQPACGNTCSMVRTKAGHVYYWGKHKSGEATMYPTLIDVLANNGHVVTKCTGGATTVICTTEHGATVSYGNGPYGELGYGYGAARSSSKPKFIDSLENVIVNSVVAGYAHTLFLLKDDTEDEKKILSKLPKVEVDQFSGGKSIKKGKK